MNLEENALADVLMSSSDSAEKLGGLDGFSILWKVQLGDDHLDATKQSHLQRFVTYYIYIKPFHLCKELG